VGGNALSEASWSCTLVQVRSKCTGAAVRLSWPAWPAVPPKDAVSEREGSSMYAVIKTGGKQYRVAADETVVIERIAGDAGATVEFTEVLMIGRDGGAVIGKPTVAGARVTAEVVEQGRADKVIAFKKRRRKNSRRKRGHRQHQTTVKIREIVAG
jgi:large subunit ribosomal protein L21